MGYFPTWPTGSNIKVVYDTKIYSGSWNNLSVVPNALIDQGGIDNLSDSMHGFNKSRVYKVLSNRILLSSKESRNLGTSNYPSQVGEISLRFVKDLGAGGLGIAHLTGGGSYSGGSLSTPKTINRGDTWLLVKQFGGKWLPNSLTALMNEFTHATGIGHVNCGTIVGSGSLMRYNQHFKSWYHQAPFFDAGTGCGQIG